jgi:hypothetical protein
MVVKVSISKLVIIFSSILLVLTIGFTVYYWQISKKSEIVENPYEASRGNTASLLGRNIVFYPFEDKTKYYIGTSISEFSFSGDIEYLDESNVSFTNSSKVIESDAVLNINFSNWSTLFTNVSEENLATDVSVQNREDLKKVLNDKSSYNIVFLMIPEESKLNDSDMQKICINHESKQYNSSDSDERLGEKLICDLWLRNNKKIAKLNYDEFSKSSLIKLNDSYTTVIRISYF